MPHLGPMVYWSSARLHHWILGTILLGGTVLLGTVTGCSRSPTEATPWVGPATDLPSAPKGTAIADPMLRQARDGADEVLLGLLRGDFDNDDNLSLVAEKLKGYNSWAISAQAMSRKKTVEFKGTLLGSAGKASFIMTMVQQPTGEWTIGRFLGPAS